MSRWAIGATPRHNEDRTEPALPHWRGTIDASPGLHLGTRRVVPAPRRRPARGLHVASVTVLDCRPRPTTQARSSSSRACTSSRAFAGASPTAAEDGPPGSGSTTLLLTCATTCATPACPRPVARSSCRGWPAGSCPAPGLHGSLWELWLLSMDCADDRFALVAKNTPTRLVDGIERPSTSRRSCLTPSPARPRPRRAPASPSAPRPLPSSAQLLTAAPPQARDPAAGARPHRPRRPAPAAPSCCRARATGAGDGRPASPAARPAPPTPLNVRGRGPPPLHLGRRRARRAAARQGLARRTNDAVLAVALARGCCAASTTAGVQLRALVPVLSCAARGTPAPPRPRPPAHARSRCRLGLRIPCASTPRSATQTAKLADARVVDRRAHPDAGRRPRPTDDHEPGRAPGSSASASSTSSSATCPVPPPTAVPALDGGCARCSSSRWPAVRRWASVGGASYSRAALGFGDLRRARRPRHARRHAPARIDRRAGRRARRRAAPRAVGAGRRATPATAGARASATGGRLRSARADGRQGAARARNGRPDRAARGRCCVFVSRDDATVPRTTQSGPGERGRGARHADGPPRQRSSLLHSDERLTRGEAGAGSPSGWPARPTRRWSRPAGGPPSSSAPTWTCRSPR